MRCTLAQSPSTDVPIPTSSSQPSPGPALGARQSEPRGFLKMLIAADSDEILGFTAFGADASELMARSRSP
jgi:pyruvate/2-oxoglutarate dehydrogenase complex dihydrolipoamide dehydrogenase (E3) component